MPVLVPQKPFRTLEPVLLVENQLAPGPHTFRLVVVDDSGVESAPVQITVEVRKPFTTGPGLIPTGPILTGSVRPGPILPGPGRTGPVLIRLPNPRPPIVTPRLSKVPGSEGVVSTRIRPK